MGGLLGLLACMMVMAEVIDSATKSTPRAGHRVTHRDAAVTALFLVAYDVKPQFIRPR